MALAYSIVKHDPPRDMRSAAKLTCAECGDTGKIIIAGMGNNPEKINHLFIRLGWDADVWTASKNWCPKCVRQRKVRMAADVEPTTVPRALPTVVLNAPRHFEPMGAGVRSSSKPDEVNTIKKLNADQRSSLRTALEAYFNPDRGQYEEGWSDHRVSEELQIARVVVVEFRENFYGEIKQDPEIVAFVQMYDEAKKVAANFQSTLAKMELKLDGLLKKHGVK